MVHELRKFPRIPADIHGELAVTKHRTDGPGLVVVSVSVRSIACKGAGVTISEEAADVVRPLSSAALSFDTGDRTVTIPATVVWSAGRRAGLRLQVDKADEETRRAYAKWIVPLTNKAINEVTN